MEQLSEFIVNNLMLFAALFVVLLLLIKAELDHMVNKGLLVSPASAIRLINNNDDALIIDIRAVAEYKNGHIKGAKNVPLSQLTSKIEGFADYRNKPVLLYCNSGNTTSKAIRLLKKAGFENINNLEGGIMAWREANMPLSNKK
jgi:rhodanese-related sulfurtransferase